MVKNPAFIDNGTMNNEIPKVTIQAFARSIIKESIAYGFSHLDFVRLVNELLDGCASADADSGDTTPGVREELPATPVEATSLPLVSERIQIRALRKEEDTPILEAWLNDKYGRFFVLSCATAQSESIESMVNDELNHFGIITDLNDQPIGALAYLDHSVSQKRAELRKLIGDPESRGKGIAEEATRMWISYGLNGLGLDKVFVSTLQTHISNIKLNERIGFQVEGVLRNEVLIDGERHDVLRMGLCRDQY